jgi:hypothetical protein
LAYKNTKTLFQFHRKIRFIHANQINTSVNERRF